MVENNTIEFCPICGEQWETCCKCFLMEKTCKNNHTWFLCPVHNEIVIGKVKHPVDNNTCYCNTRKK